MKHGSFYARVYSCNAKLKDNFSNDISAQLINLDPESETLCSSKSSENLDYMNSDNPLSSNVNESANFSPIENANSSRNSENNLQNNDINE